uniref:Uncharacterized protein n=1 Tax=Setaria italica TaxID=4555 RepID=K3Z089_SETIT
MDYEEEQEGQAEPQAKAMGVDASDAPYLDLQGDREKQAYAILKDRAFGHTKAYEPELLEKIGMDIDFASVWSAIGWDEFSSVEELGSRPLTIQFLCALREVTNGVSF